MFNLQSELNSKTTIEKNVQIDSPLMDTSKNGYAVYSRSGNVVTVNFDIVLNAEATAWSTAIIRGLPPVSPRKVFYFYAESNNNGMPAHQPFRLVNPGYIVSLNQLNKGTNIYGSFTYVCD